MPRQNRNIKCNPQFREVIGVFKRLSSSQSVSEDRRLERYIIMFRFKEVFE